MAGSLKLDGSQFLVKEGGQFKITNSELKLKSSGNTVVDSSGNAIISESSGVVSIAKGTVGSNVVFPAGHVIQVVSVSKTDTFSGTISAANADLAITGLTVNITPSSASNKIAVFFTVHGASSASSRESSFGVRLYRGSTEIGVASSPGSNRPATIAAFHVVQSSNDSSIGTVSSNILDAPNSTSQQTYSLRLVNIATGSLTFYCNRTLSALDSNYRNRCVSTITVMEVQG